MMQLSHLSRSAFSCFFLFPMFYPAFHRVTQADFPNKGKATVSSGNTRVSGNGRPRA